MSLNLKTPVALSIMAVLTVGISTIEPDKNAGITINESFAMLPTAAVSGFYFSHPDAKYFGSGKIQKDQVEDYAKRKGENIKNVERWPAPVLDYDT